MKITILSSLLFSFMFLTGCASQTSMNSNYKAAYIYTEDDNLRSKRVDYLGYGLGGKGFGGYGVGGYGLVGYGGQFPGS
ncbi:hypothetical protein [Legionella shakespearei]|uniref:Lipoprotein n=1 Tax=Legionella shakespearei DSM 23087 TaxID=1122169 RepID=A0A0W0YZR8_9GAMM|nr:hypothetical protein [Legionella shakespearei]KTD62360.1 hypothetical protein Lsha_1060 [Legionella shakespearei DSM 23087]